MKKIKINGTRLTLFFSILFILCIGFGNVPRPNMVWVFIIFSVLCTCLVYISEEKTSITRNRVIVLEKRQDSMKQDLERAYADEISYIRTIGKKDVGLFNSADMIPLQVLARLKAIDADGVEFDHFLRYYAKWIWKTVEQAETYDQLKVIFHNAGVDDCINSQYVKVMGQGVREELLELQETILREYGKRIRAIVAKDWETAPTDRKAREMEELTHSSKGNIFLRAGILDLIPTATA